MMITDSGNLGDVFSAYRDSDRIAVIDLYDENNPREISFRALNESCDAVARGLRRYGLGVGDRVAIVALNRVEYLEVMFGAMRAGCVPVMINAKLPADQIQFIIDDAGATLVFCDPGFIDLCDPGMAIIDFDGAGEGSYADFVDPGPFDSFVPGPVDIAEQPYTSGSTGRPKGVLLHHKGQRWMIAQLIQSRELTEDDCGIISAPLYHKNALLAVKSALGAGGRVVVMARFDVKQYLRCIERYRLTMLTGVPTMYALMIQQEALLADTDISSVRAISMGSAPASEVLLDNVQAAFPAVRIRLNYGITEGGPVLLAWKHADGLERPRNSVGYPLPDVEFKFVGGPSANEGVLHTRNPGVMIGYHNLPQETAKCLHDGWLDTGDILRRDEDGWFYFIGRSDDMFVTAGENIYPGDVETMLERHPDVMQAVVVPAPNMLKAHVPHAFIVPRAGATLTEDEVKQHALANAPAYAHPRRVFFMDVLPLAGTNKIDRKFLKARAAEAARADGTA
ncbi:MAG: class I adenylate-forming enzyme family protein [Proteobacteria bacterium]|nr:class I adenylate-forming enzyme family protein [Pseudomonadota bacterium]